MSEPWERFQSEPAAAAEPWERFKDEPAAPEQPVTPYSGIDLVGAGDAAKAGGKSAWRNRAAFGPGMQDVANFLGRYTLDPVTDVIKGLPVGTTNEGYRQQTEKQYQTDTPDPNSGGAHFMRGLPEGITVGALTTPLGGPVASALQAARVPATAARIGGNAAVNAGYAGARGAYNDQPLGDTLKDMGLAGLFSAGGDLFGRAVSGTRPGLSGGLKEATDFGYIPTVGEQLGKWGQRSESRAAHSRFFGEGVREGQDSALSTYSTAENNKVLSEIGGKTIKRGEAAAQDTLDQIERHYTQHLKGVELQQSEANLATFKARNEVTQKFAQMPPAALKEVEDFVFRRLTPGGRQRPLTGEEWKTLDSELGKESWRLRKSPDPDQQAKGNAMLAYKNYLADAVSNKTGNVRGNPVSEVRKADKAYRGWLAIQDATSKAIDTGGAFTPRQYAQAADRKFGKGNRGEMNPAVIDAQAPKTPAPSPMGPLELTTKAGALGLTGHSAVTMLNNAYPDVPWGMYAGVGGLAAGATASKTLPMLSHAMNSEPVRKMMIDGLSGLIPAEAIGKLRGLPAGAQREELRRLMENPQFNSAFAATAAQLGLDNRRANKE